MPRKSADARAIEPLQEQPEPLEPPPDLSADAEPVWHAIALAKPADWFDGGNVPLLETYCEITAQIRHLTGLLNQARKVRLKVKTYKDMFFKVATSKDLERRIAMLGGTQATLATKLRLTVQSAVSSKARTLAARGSPIHRDPLLGGSAVVGRKGKPN